MKFFDAYNVEYYTKRKRQSKKHTMKYLNFKSAGNGGSGEIFVYLVKYAL